MKHQKNDLVPNNIRGLCKPNRAEYLTTGLLYCSEQLIDQLTAELSGLQELRCSKITDRQIRLAEATAKITELALNVSDIDTIVQNSESQRH